MACAHTMAPNQYLIWGISGEDLEIPAGSVLTEAVLTIHDLVPANARFYIHLLDNPPAGVQFGTNSQRGDLFAGCGVVLKGTAAKGKWSCLLSKINDKNSPVWSVYPRPYTLTLANGSSVSLSSSLLALMDYLGNGSGFGFGFDFETVCTFTQITFEMTVKTFLGDYQQQTLSFRISDLYSYDEAEGKWVASEDGLPADWELAANPNLPMTITRCQVSAGKIVGQDTLTVSGSFAGVPNLLKIPSIGVSVVSLTDEALIYAEECGYTWDKTRNQFRWTRRIAKNQPGGITSLTLNFAARTLAMTITKADLTGLSSPIRFEVALGEYTLFGEADESIINGRQRIPIRLMRDYRDEIRISKAIAKRGKKPSTDQLQITGEIAVADVAAADLTTQPLVITWDRQTFTIPAGTFQKGKGNVYSCSRSALPEGGLATCKVDLDKCTFTFLLNSASVETIPGTPACANLRIGRPPA